MHLEVWPLFTLVLPSVDSCPLARVLSFVCLRVLSRASVRASGRFFCLFVCYGGLDSLEARPIVSSYVLHCRGRFGFARGCSLAYLVAVGYSLGFPGDVVAVIMGHGGLDAACARAVATLVDYRLPVVGVNRAV